LLRASSALAASLARHARERKEVEAVRRHLSAVLLVALVSAPFTGAATESVKSVRADLNGDGRMETISLRSDDGKFTLRVDGASVSGESRLSDAVVDDLAVVDVDTADRYKEISVHVWGPSDASEYFLYWYDGRAIKKVGMITGGVVLRGNGIALADYWMGFWTRREKYALDPKSRRWKLVPQELYYVGVEAEAKGTFPLYRTRAGAQVVASVAPKSKCTILLSERRGEDDSPGPWYLIRSATGIVGWAREGTLMENMQLPLAG
jgi:hypothetical protein